MAELVAEHKAGHQSHQQQQQQQKQKQGPCKPPGNVSHLSYPCIMLNSYCRPYKTPPGHPCPQHGVGPARAARLPGQPRPRRPQQNQAAAAAGVQTGQAEAAGGESGENHKGRLLFDLLSSRDVLILNQVQTCNISSWFDTTPTKTSLTGAHTALIVWNPNVINCI